LNFQGKASVGTEGIKFENGTLYSTKLDDFLPIKILGRGQFGVVQKVQHKPTNIIMGNKASDASIKGNSA
jgi:mitogen-activated protein kinase kinase